jgi:hypothetical protein
MNYTNVSSFSFYVLCQSELNPQGNQVPGQRSTHSDQPIILGRAIAQAVSHWLPTAAARVRARVWSYGICGGQSGARAGFLWVLRFPLPIFIPPIAPQSPSSINWGLYNRPEVVTVPSGLSPTPQKNHNLKIWRKKSDSEHW